MMAQTVHLFIALSALSASVVSLAISIKACRDAKVIQAASMAIRERTAATVAIIRRSSDATFDASHARPSPAQEVQAAGQEGAANG